MSISSIHFPKINIQEQRKLAGMIRAFSDYFAEDPNIEVEQNDLGITQVLIIEEIPVAFGAISNGTSDAKICRPMSIDFYYTAEELADALWGEEYDYFLYDVLGIERQPEFNPEKFIIDHYDEILERAQARQDKIFEETGLVFVPPIYGRRTSELDSFLEYGGSI